MVVMDGDENLIRMGSIRERTAGEVKTANEKNKPKNSFQ